MKTNLIILLCFSAFILISVVANESYEEEEPLAEIEDEELNCYGWWVRWKDGVKSSDACTGGNDKTYPDGGGRSGNFVKFLKNAKRKGKGESDGNNIGFLIGRKMGGGGKEKDN
ncbi:hypothetical protein MtrunA17_Chr5g0438391 [Medicago truncatula]|nr:uncharacterized protein LOC11420749 [Medicago truncatula]ABS31486.1 nodule-specific glycine-rich protein 1L [Medicago truncatula]AES99746.1 Nodule-specific Glycine Rich Peptide [Medicago truncatula]RHN57253.1 hypothetical protein MtrunA17_Chr5g0438391 [Medicago truncatula]